jgi:hypothetical protein
MSSRLSNAIKKNLRAQATNANVRHNARLDLQKSEQEKNLAYDILREDPTLYERKLARERPVRRVKDRVDEDIEFQDYLEKNPNVLDRLVAAELKKEEAKSKKRFIKMNEELDAELSRPKTSRGLIRDEASDDELEEDIDESVKKPYSLLYSEKDEEEEPPKPPRRLKKDLNEAQYEAYEISMEETRNSGIPPAQRRALAFKEADRYMMYEEPPEKPIKLPGNTPVPTPRKKFDIGLKKK